MKQNIEMSIVIEDSELGEVEVIVNAEVDTDPDGPSVDIITCEFMGEKYDYTRRHFNFMSDILMEEAVNRDCDRRFA